MSATIRALKRELAADPTRADVHDRLITLLDIDPRSTRAQGMYQRRLWWKAFGERRFQERLPHANKPDPERQLRVGYVSGDFFFHSAMMGCSPVVFGHTPAVQPILYSTLPCHLHDPITREFQSLPWRDITAASDDEACALVREDEIDVLVDLSGYTPRNRLRVFASKPAPVQVSAFGYGYPIGAAPGCIDALFSDPGTFPVEMWGELTEPVYDLPFVIGYDLPPYDLQPVARSGPPVFGVFNRAVKIDEATLRAWAEVLRRVPGSRILMKGVDHDAHFRACVRSVMGAVADRVDYRDASVHHLHIASYNDVDVSLDPFAQSGGISTMESIWMGVPVVTLRGERWVSQCSSAATMTLVGQPGFVAKSKKEYVDIVVKSVTTGRGELASLRQNLRGTLAASPICSGYIGAVEAAYRNLWRAWCARASSAA